MDPLATGVKENLTLQRLFNTLDSTLHFNLYSDMKNRLDVLQQKCEPFRDWRNRRIGHTDLSTALKFHPEPLPGISKEQVDEVLILMSAYLNVFLYYFDHTTMWYEMTSAHGGANRLVHHLENALKWRDDYFKRKQNPNN